MIREFSAGGVVYKKEDGEVLWLVAKSAPSKLYPKSVWRLPKGWIDDEGDEPGPVARGTNKASEEELQNAARREVKEEGGVEARIVAKVGTETHFFTSNGKRVMKFVTFYLMEWLKDIPSGPGLETSEVAWLSYETARKRLSYSGEKKTLDKAGEILDSGIQENLV